MSLSIKTSIVINATPDQVWKTLIQFEDYPKWNPFITSISGTAKEGEQLVANIGGMTFKPKVLEAKTNKTFRWLGHLFIKGLFDGEHYFHLHANDNNTTTLEHGELFSGLLVPLFKSKLLGETKQGFEKMNMALKETVEHILPSTFPS